MTDCTHKHARWHIHKQQQYVHKRYTVNCYDSLSSAGLFTVWPFPLTTNNKVKWCVSVRVYTYTPVAYTWVEFVHILFSKMNRERDKDCKMGTVLANTQTLVRELYSNPLRKNFLSRENQLSFTTTTGTVAASRLCSLPLRLWQIYNSPPACWFTISKHSTCLYRCWIR